MSKRFDRRRYDPYVWHSPGPRRSRPNGVIGWFCSDPDCSQGIHHLSAATEEPAPQREEAAPGKGDPFADPSDLTSEGGSSEQRTSPPE